MGASLNGLKWPRLVFDDPGFEQKWQGDNYRRSLVQVRLATAIACVIYGSYGFADPIILPREVAHISLWPQRLIGSVAIAIVFASSFASWFERYWQSLLVAGVLTAIGGLTWMWLRLELSVYWYYHNGLILILVFAFLLLRLSFRSAVIVSAITLVLFSISAFGFQPAAQVNLVTAVSLFFATGIGLFASFQLESSERKVYWQRALIESQRVDLQNSLDDLEATQTQLIQAEKLASLGQLSAGIAHEIRNPLNFVSNFASLSGEIIQDLEVGLGTADDSSAVNPEISESLEHLKSNSAHIQKHANRADQIVRRLIEHADRAGGVSGSIDLNEVVASAVEAAASRFVTRTGAELPEVRVDYHEPSIEVEMVAKEIGKVVDNLVDNALHSVYLKRSRDPGFDGRVTIKTDLQDAEALILVHDNGVGISAETRERLFEPFYTTKPTGEGTGLGLFLCYQIVASHFGELEVESRDGEWASFRVSLPVTNRGGESQP